MRRPLTRRRKILLALLIAAIVIVVSVSRPAGHLATVAWQDADLLQPLAAGYIDDASRLNASHVAEVWPIPTDPAEAESQLRELLARARRDKLGISIAGARHSMGGHTISPDGIVIDMTPFHAMSFDPETNLLRVQAGARWSEIIPYLDPVGRSVAVMQSNNSFTVGGSLSVNCHGWQYGRPPIASTVESFRLLLADGTIKTCSRTENAELFALALGGYGLFGVILDADLRVIPNARYRLEQFVVPLNRALATYDAEIAGRDDVAMAYGRLGIAPSHFLEDVIINVFHEAPDGPIPPLTSADSIKLRRNLFRGSVGSDYGKELRWSAEAKLQPHLNKEYFSRNQLLNEGVEVFQNRSAASTDILHEYFVPRSGVASFIAALRETIPKHDVDLLNVTVRFVEEDRDTFLRYATEEMFAFVMLFNQPTTAAAESEMETVSQALIEASLAAGGRYYLPYRLHATPAEFARAYPQGAEFFAQKRKYDPDGVFQNKFYLKYGRGE